MTKKIIMIIIMISIGTLNVQIDMFVFWCFLVFWFFVLFRSWYTVTGPVMADLRDLFEQLLG